MIHSSHTAFLGRWRIGVVASCLIALTLIVSACGNTTSSGATGFLHPGVMSWGEDDTGGMPYIAPKDSSNPGKPYYGFEYDIANAMAQQLGVKNQPTQITWSNWPQGLASEQFDFFMNGLEITSDTATSATFSIPYYVYTQSIIVLKTNTTIHSFADLAGKTVETGTGYNAQFIMEDYNKTHTPKINIVTTDNPTPFTDLNTHRVDAFFLDTPIAEWYGVNDPSGLYKTVGGFLDPGYYGIGFSRTNKNTPTLKKEMNRVISQLWENGTLKHIYQSGFAYNTNANGQPVKQLYNMWTPQEACIGNFVTVGTKTNVAGCPPLIAS
ncbi:MAG TPA: ABC transporter substrate-binding protein [Ktedonobacterales bacterium]|nr:ABC transporter substrate-binding protein [Ktedonobacterales bacterium]